MTRPENSTITRPVVALATARPTSGRRSRIFTTRRASCGSRSIPRTAIRARPKRPACSRRIPFTPASALGSQGCASPSASASAPGFSVDGSSPPGFSAIGASSRIRVVTAAISLSWSTAGLLNSSSALRVEERADASLTSGISASDFSSAWASSPSQPGIWTRTRPGMARKTRGCSAVTVTVQSPMREAGRYLSLVREL